MLQKLGGGTPKGRVMLLAFYNTKALGVRYLEGALERYGLPVLSPFSPEELAVAARRDKKRRGEQITLVLPERIGHCVLHSVPVEELTRWFQMGEER